MPTAQNVTPKALPTLDYIGNRHQIVQVSEKKSELVSLQFETLTILAQPIMTAPYFIQQATGPLSKLCLSDPQGFKNKPATTRVPPAKG